MNLMFWKKQGATDETGAETPAEAGLAARMRSWFAGLAGNFGKAPAFRAEVEPDAVEDHAAQSGESQAPETSATAGLFMRIKAGFAAFIRKIRTRAAPAAGEGEASLPEEALEGEPGAGPVRSRKWLVVGGSVGLLVLLLIAIGVAYWPSSEPSGSHWGTRQDTPSVSPHPGDSGPAPEEPLNEIEALRKENAELHARIEALKKAQPQQRPAAPPAWQSSGRSAPPSSVGGEMAVGSSDPKAAAMTLKEAIEAMNAASGDYRKKPAK